MEKQRVDLRLDADGTGKEYDKALKGFIPDDDALVVISKSDGTVSHRSIVMFAFRVYLPDGQAALARAVITGRNFANMAAAFYGTHPNAGDRDDPELMKKAPKSLAGHHRGVGWNAAKLEQVYLIRVEGSTGISIAGSEQEAKKIAAAAIDLHLSGK